MTLCPSSRRICAALLALSVCMPALPATQLFLDDFDALPGNNAYQAALPTAPWRYQALGATATYVGPSQASLQRLDGASVLRLNDLIGNEQRKGWSTTEVFNVSQGLRLEARFNTMRQSPTTGIDELLEIWFIDATDLQRFDFVGLSTPSFGRDRIFTSMSSPNLDGLDTHFDFQSNTWYRMVLQASPHGNVRASILADDGHTRLISTDLGHTLADYAGGIRLGFGQSMGQPGRPFPTDSALDYLQLTTAPIPEPDSVVLLLAGLAVLGLKTAAGSRRGNGARP
ncbi:PEP-CTERM domain protein [Azohydromonas australica]|uniref:PEP-CTERM domain protein n=1 Tax=Azohydromonas australica TaxID=364039 RepID=UPI000426605D|nr:PEP-CTERM domain protein [Azohydromonas australica]